MWAGCSACLLPFWCGINIFTDTKFNVAAMPALPLTDPAAKWAFIYMERFGCFLTAGCDCAASVILQRSPAFQENVQFPLSLWNYWAHTKEPLAGEMDMGWRGGWLWMSNPWQSSGFTNPQPSAEYLVGAGCAFLQPHLSAQLIVLPQPSSCLITLGASSASRDMDTNVCIF